MSSFDIWGYLGHAIPAWYRWCSENKLYACMMVFFVGNMLEAQVSLFMLFWLNVDSGFRTDETEVTMVIVGILKQSYFANNLC